MAEAALFSVVHSEEESRTNSPNSTAEKSSVGGGKKKSSSKSTRKTNTKSKDSEDRSEAGTSSLLPSEKSMRTEIDSVKASVSDIASKLDKVDKIENLLQQLISKNVAQGGQNSDSDRDATSGGQRSRSQDIATSGGQNPRKNSNSSRDNQVDGDDEVSLHPDRNERRGLGLDSDDDTDDDGSSVDRQGRTSRFHRYSWVQNIEKDSESSNKNDTSSATCTETGSNNVKNVLGDIFGEDAKTKPDKSECGISLDQSQINILRQSWHCDNPSLLSSYKDEYRSNFPVHNNSGEHLDLPKLDDVVASMLTKHHGPKANKIKGNKLFSQPVKHFENLAFKGQAAARMGLIITAYMQQALGSLMEKLNESEPNVDLVIQMVKDIFAMSVKSMDQIGRTGAFHHLIRRKATVVDTGLDSVSELADKVMTLKLSSEGILGSDFEETLQKRSETNKQIKDLLPEICHKPAYASTGTKRKFSGTASQDASHPKNTRNESAFKIPKIDKSKDTKSSFSHFKKNNKSESDKKGQSSFRNPRSK